MPERDTERTGQVKVVLHSELRRAAGLKEIELEICGQLAVRSLLGAIAEQVPALQATISQATSEPALGSRILVTVNQEIAAWDTSVQPGDTVRVMPPISGG
jgi:molybdopterin converting factor small subunit